MFKLGKLERKVSYIEHNMVGGWMMKMAKHA